MGAMGYLTNAASQEQILEDVMRVSQHFSEHLPPWLYRVRAVGSHAGGSVYLIDNNAVVHAAIETHVGGYIESLNQTSNTEKQSTSGIPAFTATSERSWWGWIASVASRSWQWSANALMNIFADDSVNAYVDIGLQGPSVAQIGINDGPSYYPSFMQYAVASLAATQGVAVKPALIDDVDVAPDAIAERALQALVQSYDPHRRDSYRRDSHTEQLRKAQLYLSKYLRGFPKNACLTSISHPQSAGRAASLGLLGAILSDKPRIIVIFRESWEDLQTTIQTLDDVLSRRHLSSPSRADEGGNKHSPLFIGLWSGEGPRRQLPATSSCIHMDVRIINVRQEVESATEQASKLVAAIRYIQAHS
jgi:hypothetical protein